jgi:DNA recombination protein Rad52
MTAFSAEIVAQLDAPLSREHVRAREQAGREVFYLEAWHVIAEANRIFGFDGWDREMVDCRCVAERETKIGQAFDRQGNPRPQKDGWRVGYVARVRVTVYGMERSVVREGTGYGSGIDVDLGAAHESAIKEAESDAMKRALMTFGNQFGLALYDKAQSNVEAPSRPAVASARPLAATAPQANGKHPKWDYAGARFREIERALKMSDDKMSPDDIWDSNGEDLDLIEKLHEPSYVKLLKLREEMTEKLRGAQRADASSAPMLTGEL